jgi:hypothetical protein
VQALRALLWPLHLTALVLLVVLALLLSFAASNGLFGIVLFCLVTIIACKYGFVLLDHAANGDREPPSLSIEMLQPGDLRPLLALALPGLALWAWAGLGGFSGSAIALLLCALLPASLGLLAVDSRRAHALLPTQLLRFAIGLGPQYLLVLAYIGAAALLAGLGVAGHVGGVLLWALALYLLWSGCTLIGMACYQRRFEIGHEPVHSPERDAERAARERAVLRGRFIDDLYVAVRLRKQGEGRALLAARLGRVPQEHLVEECDALLAAAEGWQLPRVLAWVAETLLTTLLSHGQPEASLALATRLLHLQPQFRFDTAGPRETLQQLALQSGRKELAAKLAAMA